jgi:hypothetical protein
METLANYSENSEMFSMTHVADNRPVLNAIKQYKQNSTANGWSAGRTKQLIGLIPALEYVRMCKINPELKDPNKLEKWLMSWEGAAYRIAEDGRHKSANIIIK